MRAALLGCLLAGCTKAPSGTAEVAGTLAIGGEPMTVSSCEVESFLDTVVIQLVTPKGRIRIEEKAFYFNPDPKGFMHGDELACGVTERNLGKGTRVDRTAYVAGRLAFSCKHGSDAITADLVLDCGHMTDDERKALERSTADMRKFQHDLKPNEIRKALESMADAGLPDAP